MRKQCCICKKNTKVKSFYLPYTEELVKVYKYELYSCCDYIKQEKFLGKTELETLYSSSYIGFRRNPIYKILNKIFIFLRVKKYYRYINNHDILELGCGMGDFVVGSKKYSPNSVDCVEMSSFACNYIRERDKNINVCEHDIETFETVKKYDSIFMFHVIEHVKNPEILINKCSTMLKNGGCLVIETPNYNSWDRLIFKDKWFNFHVPYHTYIFSLKSFRNIIKNSNLKLLNYSYSKFPNTLTVQFRNFSKWLSIFLWPIYILEYFVSSIFKSSGILTVIIQKNV